ncbi:MAG: hypothetical protein U9Q97_01995 [Acidobacteriota bacterium]|nr:hypothetical protein [Acidobacteriota bacterium]
MEKDWKANLARFFDELRIIENSKEETIENFDQFCEFIVEPAFEALAEELRVYGIKSKYRKSKKESITFVINFPKSGIDSFQYIIHLPKESLKLNLKLLIRGRKNTKSPMKEKEEQFMRKRSTLDILKLKKDDIIDDVIEHYRCFNFEDIPKPK